MQRQFDVVIERDEEGYYVAELCLEVEGVAGKTLEFIGIQRITVAA
jgi:predicted RNase H-like HicB family nuclease